MNIVQLMKRCADQYRKEHGKEIHKVILLRKVFDAKPGRNALYKAATKLYDRLKDLGYL